MKSTAIIYEMCLYNICNALQFYFSRQNQSTVEINRLLEKSVKDSRCVDTESLCIVAGAQVRNRDNVNIQLKW